MWKWIGGGCALIIVLCGILVYGSYQTMSKIAASGPTASVTMAGKPERVFAALANADSLPSWRLPGMATRVSHRGMLVRGDTLFFDSADSARQDMVWIVDTVVQNQLIATRGVSRRQGLVIFRRRDSLFAVGDSTTVASTTSSMMGDSAAAFQGRGGMVGGMAGIASTMGAAGVKMQAEIELKNLKNHIEGRRTTGSSKPR